MAMAHKGLAKLAEELGELQQVVGKALQVGGVSEEHWSGDLREMMQNEMGDVLAAMGYVMDMNEEINPMTVELRSQEKHALFHKWDAEDGGEVTMGEGQPA